MSNAFGQKNGTKRSRAILDRLARFEAPEVMDHSSGFPVVIRKATGARVRDADGNRYIDLGGFFGVAVVGHRNPAVIKAVRRQSARLLHGMGDVHPADVKAVFLQKLIAMMPAPDYRAVLSLNGSDAVDTALKFAAAATGRPGIIAFEGSYHGLSAGPLEATAQARFRTPFAAAMNGRGSFLPFPAADGSDMDRVLEDVRVRARDADGNMPVGALIVEPVQGRGGIRVPPKGFLSALASIAADEGLVLITDEVFTGVGRTGAFLAGDHEGLAPDAVCIGKSLGGGIPISACLMRGALADAVKGAQGEAVHTSTFLGHPLGCAAGAAVLDELARKDLYGAADRIGAYIAKRANAWTQRFDAVRDCRGRGAMMGVELVGSEGGTAMEICAEALRRGVILLTAGEAGNVLSFTPPLVIEDHDLARAMDVVEECVWLVLGRGEKS
ncbi:MAG: aspartate aminotransferase family protein [Deltaproteobacteria bacterium]|nr:aspartate aminotransferase family protein [Deltaproteobacteria bacterium]